MTLSAVIEAPGVGGLSRQEQEAYRTRALTRKEALTQSEELPRAFEVPIPGGKFVIETIGAPPKWTIEVASNLARLLYLEPNWDSYGAKEIDLKSAIVAIDLLLRIMEDDTPSPSVVPTNVGGIQYEWHEKGKDLEIEILSSDTISWFFRDLDTAETDEGEQRLNSDLSKLIDYVNRLSVRGR